MANFLDPTPFTQTPRKLKVEILAVAGGIGPYGQNNSF
jgi:hypothetical protein